MLAFTYFLSFGQAAHSLKPRYAGLFYWPAEAGGTFNMLRISYKFARNLDQAV
jgi:hypothetical protein